MKRFLCSTPAEGERGGSVVECRTPEREVRGSRPTAAVLCPWARHFTPRKYWLITQEAMAPSRHDWKIVDWDVKPQHNQPTNTCWNVSKFDYIVIYRLHRIGRSSELCRWKVSKEHQIRFYWNLNVYLYFLMKTNRQSSFDQWVWCWWKDNTTLCMIKSK